MKKLSDIEVVYKELLAMQHIIETGFRIPTDDLHVRHIPRVEGGYNVEVIVTQADKTAAIGIGYVHTDGETFLREWEDAVAVHNAAPDVERDAMTLASTMFNYKATLFGRLLMAGFKPGEQL